ncbi:MAG: hypothetical protein Tp176DCM1853251_31 [Prokaryotic dsDNA virus sp.]|nr:MAG: hypothetical protein Tp176DCM1853251_31 [Prokaryotic dsDNA virus sp.]|tara:strand:- start:2309 stop:2698 length:390 start_codon:yes stop_codon:yes gene_type:complete
MPEIPELKPCPFCGGTDLRQGIDETWVRCQCGAEGSGASDGSKQRGRDRWNTRAAPKVKPLEWEPVIDCEDEFCITPVAQYSIKVYEDGLELEAISALETEWIDFSSKDAAKAAAQEDYESRILSALDL